MQDGTGGDHDEGPSLQANTRECDRGYADNADVQIQVISFKGMILRGAVMEEVQEEYIADFTTVQEQEQGSNSSSGDGSWPPFCVIHGSISRIVRLLLR